MISRKNIVCINSKGIKDFTKKTKNMQCSYLACFSNHLESYVDILRYLSQLMTYCENRHCHFNEFKSTTLHFMSVIASTAFIWPTTSPLQMAEYSRAHISSV